MILHVISLALAETVASLVTCEDPYFNEKKVESCNETLEIKGGGEFYHDDDEGVIFARRMVST